MLVALAAKVAEQHHTAADRHPGVKTPAGDQGIARKVQEIEQEVALAHPQLLGEVKLVNRTRTAGLDAITQPAVDVGQRNARVGRQARHQIRVRDQGDIAAVAGVEAKLLELAGLGLVRQDLLKRALRRLKAIKWRTGLGQAGRQ